MNINYWFTWEQSMSTDFQLANSKLSFVFRIWCKLPSVFGVKDILNIYVSVSASLSLGERFCLIALPFPKFF